jgi:hypothetical protein
MLEVGIVFHYRLNYQELSALSLTSLLFWYQLAAAITTVTVVTVVVVVVVVVVVSLQLVTMYNGTMGVA